MGKTKTPAEDPTKTKLIATYSEETPDGDIFYKGFAEIKLDIAELIGRPMADACAILAQTFNRVAPAEFQGPEPNTKDTFTVDFEDKTVTRLIETGIETFSQLLGYAAAEIEKPEYFGLKAVDFFNGGLSEKILAAAWDAMQQGAEPEAELDPEAKLDPETKRILDSIALGQARTVYRTNNVAANDLLTPAIYTKEARGGLLHEVFADRRKKAQTLVRVSIKDRKDITTSRPVTEYDDALQTAINSIALWQIQNGSAPIMTLDQICRQLKGGARVGIADEDRAAALDAINRLQDLTVYIDATEEMQLRGVIPPGKKWVREGPVLLLRSRFPAFIGGHEVDVFEFVPSVLVEYSRENGHQTRAALEIFDIHEIDENGQITEKRVSDSNMRVQIRNYLWRRISLMEADEQNAREKLRKYRYKYQQDQKKPPEERENLPNKTIKDFRDNERKRVILFSTLYSALGITRNLTRVQKYVFDVLDYWVASNKSNLKSYTAREKSRKPGSRSKKKQVDAIANIEFWGR